MVPKASLLLWRFRGPPLAYCYGVGKVIKVSCLTSLQEEPKMMNAAHMLTCAKRSSVDAVGAEYHAMIRRTL